MPYLAPSEAISWLLIHYDIASYYLEEDVWPVYRVTMPGPPEAPRNLIAVYDTTPINEGMAEGLGVLVHPGFTVLVRSYNYDDGWNKVNEIKAKFDAVLREIVIVPPNEHHDEIAFEIVSVVVTSGPIALGPDTENKLQMFSLNAVGTIKQLPLIPVPIPPIGGELPGDLGGGLGGGVGGVGG